MSACERLFAFPPQNSQPKISLGAVPSVVRKLRHEVMQLVSLYALSCGCVMVMRVRGDGVHDVCRGAKVCEMFLLRGH